MNRLEKLLRAQIRETGPMTIAHYMEMCLLHPTLGYYNRPDPIGAAGGFTTAPEISQMFGELTGLALASAWLDQGRPDRFTLLDLGPGRGTLASDILRATASVAGFNHGAHLHLLEASETLRGEQASRLGQHGPVWLDKLDCLPEMPLYAIANEFFDVLPIRQFRREANHWSEFMVGLRDDKMVRGYMPAEPGMIGERHADATPGEIVEIRPGMAMVMPAIGDRIQRHGGVLLVIDYGDMNLRGDTFQAMSDNRHVDPLQSPGEADLTSHVDFGALIDAGGDLCHAGPCPQGEFLLRLGVAGRSRVLAEGMQGEELRQHEAATRRLVDRDKMGQLFKVMAFHPCTAHPPPGFA